MSERKALGKGLGSLLPTRTPRTDTDNKIFIECDLDSIIPNDTQPRKLFDKNSIDELAASIEEKGILQPLIVRKIGGGKYELIAGERRYRAARQLHLEKIPVLIKDIDSKESLELALIENIQREDLNPIEEALAYKELLDKYQYTQDELAQRLGRDRSSIANTLRLLKLPEDIRSHIIANKISMGHARALLGLDNQELQHKLAKEIIDNELSVRDIESLIRSLKSDKPSKIGTSSDDTVIEKVLDNPYKQIEEEMKKFLKTKVQIKSKGDQGKLIIHFHTADELNTLYDRISA